MGDIVYSVWSTVSTSVSREVSVAVGRLAWKCFNLESIGTIAEEIEESIECKIKDL